MKDDEKKQLGEAKNEKFSADVLSVMENGYDQIKKWYSVGKMCSSKIKAIYNEAKWRWDKDLLS